MYELGLIGLIGLIFLGPRQLAETAKVVGRIIRELQKMATDVQRTINLDIDSSGTSSPKHDHGRPANTFSSESPSNRDKDLILPKDDKSGPDFYAELLASSAESEEKTKTASSIVEGKSPAEKPPSKEKESNV